MKAALLIFSLAMLTIAFWALQNSIPFEPIFHFFHNIMKLILEKNVFHFGHTKYTEISQNEVVEKLIFLDFWMITHLLHNWKMQTFE